MVDEAVDHGFGDDVVAEDVDPGYKADPCRERSRSTS